MRRGFTMIELIFVIVIIGILAAVAIPKLAATRDDAKVAKSIANLKTCLNDAGAAFTATGTENNQTAACNSVQRDNCFSVAIGSTAAATKDGNVTVKNLSNAAQWCVAAQKTALDKNLSNSSASGLVHEFGGSHVVFE